MFLGTLINLEFIVVSRKYLHLFLMIFTWTAWVVWLVTCGGGDLNQLKPSDKIQ